MSGATDVLCIGETMALVVPDPPIALEAAQRLRLTCAGAESNVAAWLAALGTRAQWCGRVGADPLGERILAELRGHGVGVDVARFDASAPTGVFFKDPTPSGTRVWYYRSDSAGSRLDTSDVDRGLATAPRIVHLSGITAAISCTGRAAVDHALAEARRREITISFDVNHRPALWRQADAGTTLAELAARADVVFVGRDEAAALWGTGPVDEVRDRLPDVPVLVVKDGALDACAFVADRVVRVPALPTAVTEPVGAGDAFAAGYLRGYLRELPVAACLRLGHLVARCALSSVADVDAAGLEGLEELAAEGSSW